LDLDHSFRLGLETVAMSAKLAGGRATQLQRNTSWSYVGPDAPAARRHFAPLPQLVATVACAPGHRKLRRCQRLPALRRDFEAVQPRCMIEDLRRDHELIRCGTFDERSQCGADLVGIANRGA